MSLCSKPSSRPSTVLPRPMCRFRTSMCESTRRRFSGWNLKAG